MLLLFLATVAALPHPSHQLKPLPRTDNMHVIDPGSASADCPPISRYEAARRGGKLKPNLLTELPAADMYNAVFRTIGSCVAPIIVRYDVGRR